MKSNHLNGQPFVCTALALLKKILFASFILTSAILSISQAQNFVDAGRNKIIRFPEYAQLQARPVINGIWKEHSKTSSSTLKIKLDVFEFCFISPLRIL